MELRDLGPGDRREIERFECGGNRREEYVQAVEYMITQLLPVALEHRHASAVGLWDDSELCAVVIWRTDDEDPTL